MKKILNYFKEYLSVILIVPTIIGGLYQLINIIYYVGFPYVRFFSVAQVVPDGILVGMFIIYFSSIYYIVNLVLRFFSNNIGTLGGVKTKWILIVLSTIMLIIVSYRFITFNSESMIGASLGDFFWLNLFFANFLIVMIFGINLSVGNNPNVMKTLYWFLFSFYLIFFISGISSRVKGLNESIINDYQFYNPNFLINKMREKEKITKIDLLYANRDYLFFRIDNAGVDQILVVDAKKLTSPYDDKSE